MSTQDIVAKLWRLCHVLRDDGITYHQYVTELTYLLFLKMMKETGTEKQLPAGYRWDDLEDKDGVEQLTSTARCSCTSARRRSQRVQAIYANASTSIKVPKNLAKLVEDPSTLDWYEARKRAWATVRGAAREERHREVKSGAGQYFTPRPLIDSDGAPGEAAGRRAGAGPGGGNLRVPDRGRSLHEGRDRQGLDLSCPRGAGLPEVQGVLRRSSWCRTRTAWR
jgi:hypothetical protein